MVTTLGAALAAAAVAEVAVLGFLMTTFCAAADDPWVATGWSVSATTVAPAPPPITAPATRPAIPIRIRPDRRGSGAAGGPNGSPGPPGPPGAPGAGPTGGVSSAPGPVGVGWS